MFGMDTMTVNKIAGSLLGAVLLVMGLNILSEAVYHPEKPEQTAITIELPDADTATAAAEEEKVSLAALLTAASVDEGQKVFKKCSSCHTGEEGGANKTGPNLYNVVDRTIGAVDGYAYSDVLKGKSAEKWSYENLYAFLENPKGFASGTKMAFKLSKSEDRANILAYLRTLSASPVDFPTE
jgi:cytochrome c